MEKALNSNLLVAVRHEDDDQILYFYMASGQRRVHSEVPKAAVSALLSSSSPSRYYIKSIRKRFNPIQIDTASSHIAAIPESDKAIRRRREATVSIFSVKDT